jgi:hypothetical protein
MNTSTAVISPQTAPRSIEELSKIGIFQLRLLIDKLGGLQTPEQKQAFASLKAEEKVNLAAQLLAAWDKQNGGTPQQAPAPHMNGAGAPTGFAPAMSAAAPAMAPMGAAPMQMMTQPMGAPQMGQAPSFGGFPQQAPQMPPPQGMQQVDPASVAAAQAAAQPTTTTRKPRTAKADAGDSELGAQMLTAISQLGGMVQHNNEQITGLMQVMGAAIEEAKKNASIRDDIKQLNASYSGVYNVLASWDQRINTLQQSTNLAIALVLFMAEQTLGASKQDLIQAAIGDIPAIVSLLQVPGKA